MKLNFEKIAQIAQQIFSEQTGQDLTDMGTHGKNIINESVSVALIALEMAKRIANGAPLTSDARALLDPQMEMLVRTGVSLYQQASAL